MRRTAFFAVLAIGFLFIVGICAPRWTAASDDAVLLKKVSAKPARLRIGGAKEGFTGRVVRISLANETLCLKNGENTVTFDASSPVLAGYRLFSDIQVGDSIAVSYAPQGLKVTKLLHGSMPAPAFSGITGNWRGKLVRLARHGSGSDFDDVDANKDGKITPVELSMAIPDLTLDQFRRYDVNNKGYLDRAEFAAAMKQEKRAAKAR